MKRVDHWLGTPLCAAAGAWLSFCRIFKGKEQGIGAPRSILVLKWFGIGSIVLFSPYLEKVRKAYPGSKIIFLTFESRKEIVRLLGICDEIRVISVKNAAVFVRDTLYQLLKFGVSGVDVCIDLEFFSKYSTLVSFFSGARSRIGFFQPYFWRESIVNFPVYFNSTAHISRTYRMIVGALGVEAGTVAYKRIEFPEKERALLRAFLEKEGISAGDRIVSVNPNAGELADCRRWPKEYFIETIKGISRVPGVKVVIIGSEAEAAYVAEIEKSLDENTLRNTRNLAGKLNIRQFLQLIGISRLLITNDSGPFHLAYIQQTPSISIWGPGSPDLYGVKDGRHRIFYADYDCSPCLYLYRAEPGIFCRGKIPCLGDIKPEEVIGSALEILNEKE
ncbi:MAG: glycosyltransferase family 9 protein [Candidatus Omnitrophota bacterium]